MSSGAYERMSRADLIAAVRSLEARTLDDGRIERIVADLHAHQEEVRAQQAKLLDSQRALEVSLERYTDLFDFAPVGYVTVDWAGRINEANLTLAELLGVQRGHLLGMPLLGYVAAEDRRALQDHLRAFAPHESSRTMRGRMRRADRQLVPVELTTRAWRSALLQGVEYHMAIVDLTERSEAEAECERVKRERARLAVEQQAARAASEAKDHFLAVASHELRAPLAPMLYAVEALEREGVPPRVRARLEMIRRNVRFESRLVDDLLDVTRIAHGKFRLVRSLVDVHELLVDIVQEAADEIAAKQLTTTMQLGADRPWVHADALRLRQLFGNLLSNAIRNTPPGGRITCRSQHPGPARLRVAIEDTGSGIAPADLARLFEPFEQGRVHGGDGLGLGLAIVRGIVEAHGGSVSAESDGEGRGASFGVELPVASSLHAGPVPVSAAEPAARGDGR